MICDYALPQEWTAPLTALLETEAATASKTAAEAVYGLRDKMGEIARTAARLTDLYVAEDLEREEYLSRRRALMSERRTMEEQIVRLERAPTLWVEPVRNWITDASTLNKIAESEDLPSKKSSLQKIFGLNLSLHARQARGTALPHYAALCAARISPPEKEMSFILEPPPRVELGTLPLRRVCSTN